MKFESLVITLPTRRALNGTPQQWRPRCLWRRRTSSMRRPIRMRGRMQWMTSTPSRHVCAARSRHLPSRCKRGCESRPLPPPLPALTHATARTSQDNKPKAAAKPMKKGSAYVASAGARAVPARTREGPPIPGSDTEAHLRACLPRTVKPAKMTDAQQDAEEAMSALSDLDKFDRQHAK